MQGLRNILNLFLCWYVLSLPLPQNHILSTRSISSTCLLRTHSCRLICSMLWQCNCSSSGCRTKLVQNEHRKHTFEMLLSVLSSRSDIVWTFWGEEVFLFLLYFIITSEQTLRLNQLQTEVSSILSIITIWVNEWIWVLNLSILHYDTCHCQNPHHNSFWQWKHFNVIIINLHYCLCTKRSSTI